MCHRPRVNYYTAQILSASSISTYWQYVVEAKVNHPRITHFVLIAFQRDNSHTTAGQTLSPRDKGSSFQSSMPSLLLYTLGTLGIIP